MEKIKCLYKRQYKDILIEVRQIGVDKVSLYINGVERDYFRIFSSILSLESSKESPNDYWTLKCQLNNETAITIIYKPVLLRNTITVYINRTQIDYVKKVKPI